MAIENLKIRPREGGRIRIGAKKRNAQGKEFPVALTQFRITSHSKEALEKLAEIYGGQVVAWKSAPTEGQWELMTESNSLNVVIPPTELGFSQWMEYWQGGTCERRCNGLREQISDQPCLCDPDALDCKPRTRLAVLFPELDSMALFRVETGSWSAAAEMAATVSIIEMAQSAGRMLPAFLKLEQRAKKTRNPDGVVETKKFSILALEIAASKLMLNTADAVAELPEVLAPIAENVQSEVGSGEAPKAVTAPSAPSQDDKPWVQKLNELADKAASIEGLDARLLLKAVIQSYIKEAQRPEQIDRETALKVHDTLRAVVVGAASVIAQIDENGEIVGYELEAF